MAHTSTAREPMMAAIPTALVREASASAVVYRLLIEIQLRGGVGAFTAPVSAPALAESVASSPASVKHAVLWLLGRGYIHRGYGSGPHGGRLPRYRIAWDRPTTGGAPYGLATSHRR